MCLKLPASRVFTQSGVQVQFKEYIKLCVAGVCVGNALLVGWFPSQRTSNEEMFAFDDTIMILIFHSKNAFENVSATPYTKRQPDNTNVICVP